MALPRRVSQVCLMLATLYGFVVSQQATLGAGPAPTDANTLFSNLLATSNAPGQQQPGQPQPGQPQSGQPQPQLDPNFSSFPAAGATDFSSAGAGFGMPAGLPNIGFPAVPPGAFPAVPPGAYPPRFPPQSFPMGGAYNTAPAQVPRPGGPSSLLPLMMMRGSDTAQALGLMSMMSNGGLGGGMMGNPLFMYSLMNM